MWNDTELQVHVERELSWEPGVHTTQMAVLVKNGAVQLVGHVDAFWEKCAAECAVWRVAHVKSVTNELRVELPFNALRGDDDIALAAMGILEWNCVVPDTVEVQVVDGWVTLTGQADGQYQKREAERALSTLKGIKGIRNEIIIRSNGHTGDVKLPIEDALKRNALVDTSHIKVHVHHGIVRLDGFARSRAEHDQAMQAAWSAPGAIIVEDHISIA